MNTRNQHEPISITFFKKPASIPPMSISKLIHDGNFSDIYTAEIDNTKELVAVKKIKAIPDATHADRLHADNLREVTIMGMLTRLNANNILKLEFYFLDLVNNYNIVTKYAAEGALSDWLPGDIMHPPLRPRQQKAIMCGVAKGVSAMHEADIIHCAITPDHIILDKFLHPMLCDFRHAKRLGIDEDSLDDTDAKYLAPEVLLDIYVKKISSNLTKASDIFSLAITCWQIVSGAKEVYVDIEDIDALIKSVVHEMKREAIPGKRLCAPNVAKFIRGGWAPNPQDRPSVQDAFRLLSKANVVKNNAYDTVDLAIVIDFLYEKVDFFAAPFTDLESFQQWAEANECALKPLSDGLKLLLTSQDQMEAFKNALIGKSEGDTNCLRARNDTLMKEFLLHEAAMETIDESRIRFIPFLLKQLDNPIINEWYTRKRSANNLRC